ncbi:MAG: hypothetical protein RJA22_3182 [Verrucomicrobiota bacterium]
MNRLPCPALRPLLAGLVLLAATLLAPAATNIALSYKFDGATPLDPNTTKLYGSAQLRPAGNYLALTDQAQYQKGTFLIDALPRDQRLSSLRAQFLIRLDKGSSGTPADGFSFNFGPELLPDAVGEDGITNGLAVTFDSFDNGGGDSAPAVEVLYNSSVLAGATFAGRTRTAVWTNDTNGLSFSTGTNYIPVIIDLVPDAGGSFSLVSVTWNGSNMLSNVRIPYTPAQGWRVAYGARTGAFYETHYLRDVELSGDTTVQLTINSEYGRTRVDPPAGTSLRSPGDNIVLSAPAYIYLDRYRRELPETPLALSSVAHYRARLVTTSPAPGSTLTLEKDTVVTWQWELQNLAEVNTGTEGITGLSPTDVTDPTHVDTLGRRYLAPNTTGFDSIVYKSIQGSAQPVRFAARSFVMENAPASPERYLELAGEGDHLRANGTDPAALFEANGSFTVEFWARVNDTDTPPTQDQVALGLGSQAGARQQVVVGFGTDRGFFIDNRQARVAAPGSWTDDSWHHWAVVNDAGGGAVRLYRNGTLIQQSSPALAGYAGDGTLVVGALAAGTNSGGFFGGGLNNLRVWRSALTREAVVAALVTPRFTNSRPNLALELPFDAQPNPGTSNVVVLQFNGTNALNSITQLGRYTLGTAYFTDGFRLPSTNTLPLVNQTLTLVQSLFNATNGGGTVTDVNGPFDGPWIYNGTNGTWSTAGQDTNLGRAPSTLLSFPAVTLSQAGRVFLGFNHNHSFETTPLGAVDGGQVRVSVNGGPFTAVPPSAFRQGGYNSAIAPDGAEALAGQPAFTASRNTPYNSTADLGLFQPGDTLAVQFLAAFDPSARAGNPAWTLRSVSLTNQLAADNYHAWVFRSQLEIDTGGDYTFHLGSDDGSQLWVDGLLLINNDGQHGSNNVSATVTLPEGSRLVEVRMFDSGGLRALSLQYEGPGVARQDLPAERLSLTASDLLAAGVVTNYSTEGRLIGFTCRGFESLFPPNTLASNMLAAVQPGFQLGLVLDSGTTTVTIPANGKAPLNDWRRVFWGWNKQFQFKVSVSCQDAAGLAAVARLPFFAGNSNPTNSGSASLGQGVVDVLSEWLNEGAPLTVGTVYRTPDRRYTLSGLNGNVNLFGSISLDDFLDGSRTGAVSREYSFPAVSAPGSLTFQFARTVHRASLALGQALDVATLASANAALYPELPVGATNLLVTLGGPAATEQGSPPNGVIPGGSNSPWAWDFVGRRWFPTKPGVFTITWPDLRGYTNTLEVSARFPTDPETRGGFRGWERKDGTRQGSPADQYLFTVDYPGVATNYPGAPLAHYAYNLPPGGTTPAVADLDPSATDRWFFKDFAYAENNTAQLAQNRFFSDTRQANRSVLVFSRRPNPKETATGDPALESLVVRVSQAVLRTNEASAVVGSKLESPDDLSGFHAGYVTTDSLNYNPTLHDRTAVPGQWGPVYPVNARFRDSFPLSVVWFYNTAAYGDQDPLTQQPGVTTVYTNVAWPDPLNPATPVIYLSSQLGSEGVGQSVATGDTPNYQEILNPARIANLAIYQQPDRAAAGFNPNEEHAFLAPSKAFVLTADPRFNLGQSAAFALQRGLNNTNLAEPDAYTSHPFVLVQYTIPGATNASDAAAMRAYAVQAVRSNATAEPFPRVDPATGTVRDANNQPVPQPANPLYDFHYTALAGDLVVPPYPLSVALGNVVVTNTTGGNIAFVASPGVTNLQRALWQDRNGNRWTVSGGGRFFQRYWYPLRDDFWLGEERPPAGTPLAWIPENVPQGQTAAFTQAGTLAVAARYDTRWGNHYPVLKKGETLTYAGGEYKADHPGSPGLPAVLNWASAEVLYDSTTPSMAWKTNGADGFRTFNFTTTAARITRPLDRLAAPLAQAEMPDALQPKNPDQVLVVGTRWYFLNLPASLGQRFYYDTLAGQLVFRGRLNNLESGAPNLTQQPVQPYVLQPNFLTEEDVDLLLALPGGPNAAWTEAVEQLHQAATTAFTTPEDFGLGVAAANTRTNLGALPFYAETNLAAPLLSGVGDVVPISSLGIGSALVATPWFLQSNPDGPAYVTLAENNDPAAGGAVALHVIQLSPERYRGSILVLTPPDAFSENINLTHTADFGGNTAEVYYQWWIHDVTALDQIGAPDDTNFPTQSGWQIYQQGLGLNAISFTGRPDITLADKFFFVRYGAREELQEAAEGNAVTNGVVADASWRDVRPDDPAPDWSSTAGQPVPYQWAGAANSPQLQADGSRRYLPQLVMGWVKRVLDQINAYEARYSATFNGDAPATYSSMLMEAGGPYIGPVALNADKNSLENVGLIQLYETVLQRAKDLTAGPNANPGTDQALLLAATRLAALYRLLGGEAYFDAQSAIVPQSPDLDDGAAAELFAFKNEVATALDEQLALLRGTDFIKSYPSFNRLFWNYLKADGEAAYNATYNIQDLNQDGLIDESDAALQYPMGHGDAWGHYLSAVGMHYNLLRRIGFSWQARAELYSLLGNVLPVDYLDEKTFAVVAAEKARAGLGIVQATYRQAFSADPDAQWQGYTDTADPARAWGVAEWSRRVGQGALFDWLTANAITPATVTNTAEGLDRIDRAANIAEVSSLAGALSDLQSQLDLANRGQNPLGLDPDAMAFDLNPFYDSVWWERMGQFQQVFDRAVDAANNARAALSYAARADQQLQRIANDTRALQESALLQDLDYRNRLIQIYGTPYQGTIGAGKIFAEGYAGPDLVTYAYIDSAEVGDLVPQTAPGNAWFTALIQASNAVSRGLDFSLKSGNGTLPDYTKLFQQIYLTPTGPQYFLANTNPTGNPQALVVRLPLVETADYALTAPSDWGRRSAPGEIQFALNDLLAGQLAQEAALEAYNDYVHGVGILAAALIQKTKGMQAAQQANRWYYQRLVGLETSIMSLEGIVETFRTVTEPESKELEETIETGLPQSVGLLNGIDLFFPVRASLKGASELTLFFLKSAALAAQLTAFGLELDKIVEEHGKELDGETLAQFTELVEGVEQLADQLKEEESVRLQVGAAIQQVRMAADRVRAVMAEGERLQQERTALNRQIAAAAQRNRYGDLIARLTRNEAVRKYDATLDNALRYAWLAARAYDYETSLSERHPAGITTLLADIVQTRQLGQWEDGEPRLGNAGLAGILARLKANYQALQGQIGLNNLQFENNIFSLRSEAFRITTDKRWREALSAARVPDLWQVPEFRQYCRPFDHPTNGAQPGLVLQFSTEITPGQNFFGRTLSALDHTYSVANFATKIREVAVAFPGYDQGTSPSLSLSPRIYLLPVGADLQRCSDTQFPTVRSWNVVSQRIPIPFVLNEASLRDPGFQPSLEGLDGSYADRIRFGDFRAFTSGAGFTTEDEMFAPANPAGWSASARLSGRSVWNTRWLLIIPGATLSADKDQGLLRFINTVTDIKLGLQTYSNMGM